MKVQIKVPSVTATIHNDQGDLILSYTVSNYELVADGQGLIDAGLELKAKLEEAASKLDTAALLRDLNPSPTAQ